MKKSVEKDKFGTRLKSYEMAEAGRKLMYRLPIICRLDGKGFSKFTQGLKRPYDERLSNLMVETTKFLVKDTVAVCGYTQSDEITLAWYSPTEKIQNFFDGRIQKINSVLAAKCSVRFNKLLPKYIPEKTHEEPVFDCRTFNVPDLIEGANCFLWRELDATKNAISMAAQEYYEHKELMHKNNKQKQELLFARGINFNNYPSFFKRGSFVQKRTIKKKFTTDEIDKLPEKHLARFNPDLIIERTEYPVLDMPIFRKVTNRVGVIFYNEQPILKEEDD